LPIDDPKGKISFKFILKIEEIKVEDKKLEEGKKEEDPNEDVYFVYASINNSSQNCSFVVTASYE
jgi:hypothetical protein